MLKGGVWVVRFLVCCVMFIASLDAQAVEGHVVSSATGGGIGGVAVNLFQDGKFAHRGISDAQGYFRMGASRTAFIPSVTEWRAFSRFLMRWTLAARVLFLSLVARRLFRRSRCSRPGGFRAA